MAAHFTPDPHQGPGFGIISVEDLTCDAPPSFALYRASDGQCLSAHDWTTAETYLEPSAWDCDSGALRLAVGPQITDNLDSLDTYRIFIQESGSTKPPHTASLMIDDIIYSTMEGGQGIGQAGGQPQSSPPEPTPLSMTPETAPPVESAAPLMEPITVPKEPVQEEPAPQEGIKKEEPQQNTQAEPTKSKSGLWIVLLILLLLAAAGAGLWWLYQNGHLPMVDDILKNLTEESTGTPEKEAPKADGAQGDGSQQDASEQNPSEQNPSGAAPAAPVDIMAKTYELLRQEGTADASLALVENIKTHPDFTGDAPDKQERAIDAIFLLTEDAAQKGSASAMSQLAAFYDPTSTAPKGSIMPDPQQAYSWYTKAKDAGDVAATQSLQQLRTWAEQEAANGNASAQALLNAWK